MKKLHPAWTALVVTFLTLMATAGFRSAPSVMIVPLENAFGWSRSQVSLAIAINVLLYGLIAPFAAALMERFTVRKVVMTALTFVALSAASTIFISQPWHLWALWGVCVGIGTGSMALVFAATIANRWFLDRVATHILAYEGDSKWFWFEGNFESYEENKIARLGADAARPHRATYRKLTR